MILKNDVCTVWGRGLPKSRRQEGKLCDCDSDKGEGAKKFKNFADVIVLMALTILLQGISDFGTIGFCDIRFCDFLPI